MKNMVHLRVELAEDIGPENRIILLGLAYRVKLEKMVQGIKEKNVREYNTREFFKRCGKSL
jgi:hypothetical protein